MKVAVYGRLFDDNYASYIQRFFDILESLEAEVFIYEPFHDFLSPRVKLNFDPTLFTHHTEIRDRVDYMVSIGGDGTFLDTTTLVRDSGIPVIGINTGRMGFLSGIDMEDIEQAMKAIGKGEYELDRRTLLKLESNSNLFGEANFALNEITLHKKDSASMITIHVYMDGEFLNSYWADGLIIATPTGSTAYSLSCGGPIILPGTGIFEITPIAPHNLNVRPVVIPDDCVITLRVEGRNRNFLLSLDSRSESIDASVDLTISKNSFNINILRLQSQRLMSTLRSKLNWGLDKRN